eukprot:PhF_6_TR22216/c0_g1_i2/m.31370
MSHKPQRVRTESMVQRLSKKPISEGFELMDKGYVFGALRLFQFKVETSPPFQVASCLDALAMLYIAVGAADDAVETFELAIEKYNLIQNPLLAQVMKIKIAELNDGVEEGLKVANAAIASIGEVKDAKGRAGAGRMYTTRGELYIALEKFDEACADFTKAIEYGWDRVHVSHYFIGSVREMQNDLVAACAAYEASILANKNYLQSYLSLIPLLRAQGQQARALELCDTVMEIHPSCGIVKEKAYALSELGRDDEAVTLLDQTIRNPPHAETEAHMGVGQSVSQLHKAKCAIYGDQGKYLEASDAIACALAVCHDDAEAKKMSEDIQDILSKDYLERTKLPALLDAMVRQALVEKPKDVPAYLLKLLVNGKV